MIYMIFIWSEKKLDDSVFNIINMKNKIHYNRHKGMSMYMIIFLIKFFDFETFSPFKEISF